MQRRNVPIPSASSSSSSVSAAAPISRRKGTWGRQSLNKKRSITVDVSIVVMLLVALLLTVVTYMFPVRVQKVEDEAAQEIDNLMYRGQQPPVKGMAHGDLDGAAAVPKLSEMGSKWVDGEIFLKKRLEILAQRQDNDHDIGVPVLTRWLGEDIPAWPTDPENPMPEDEWKKRVEEKYAQMGQEEMEWRAQMTAHLENELQGRG